MRYYKDYSYRELCINVIPKEIAAKFFLENEKN